MTIDRALAKESRAWPFEEAERILKRLNGKTPEKGYVLFETGYGPSGLPHIGTFGEVFRTTLVRRAFQKISDIPTRLFAFSDDMDGLRKVPDNIPNPNILRNHVGKPLTSIPNPFPTEDKSFGEHNNNMLKRFLDSFDFDYEFKSATECYKSGGFNNILLKALEYHTKIVEVVGPTLNPERIRTNTYSPFIPLDPQGFWFSPKFLEADAKKGIIRWDRSIYWNHTKQKIETADSKPVIYETSIYDGNCKLQWKPDWGMRWAAFGVDYEMHGKDLIPSADLSSQICRILGGRPPELFTYELFLDEHGHKISKSKGNGITIDEWLRYATPESLALFMYQSPKKAKRLHFDVIPKHVDEYLAHLSNLDAQEEAKKLGNPAWHIHDGKAPKHVLPLSFNLLLNLASACNPEDKAVLWGFISRYAPEARPEKMPELDLLVGYAMAYYEDFVKPHKRYRPPDDRERKALEDLAERLKALPETATAEAIQNAVFDIGKAHGFENLRDWFGALYEILLGQKEGPRMGSFIKLYGIEETLMLLYRALKGEHFAA